MYVRFLLAAAALALLAMASDDAAAQAASTERAVRIAQASNSGARAAKRRAPDEARKKELINSNTVGLAAGRIEGAPLRFAAELARVLDDGDEMRVLPIITRGIFDNIFDLLYLRGVDTAIVYGDVLEHFKKDAQVRGISSRINYLMSLFPAELHIMARPEIKSIEDLAGKPVNFNTKGTAAAYTGPIVFERLGIAVDQKFDPHPEAIGEMIKGDKYAAVVFVSSKPLTPFVRRKWPPGFRFLPVKYGEKLEEYYLPAYLEATDYPTLIPEGQKIETIAVPAVLAVYDWPQNTERHRRMAKFVDYLFDRFSRLQTEPGYHEKWKTLNLAAKVPGWERFDAMGAKLSEVRRPAKTSGNIRVSPALAREQAEAAAPGNKAEQERLFREFLEWAKKNKKE